MQPPVEVMVEEGAEMVARVAAIDVAKASGMVCTRTPPAPPGVRRVTKVWPVKATTRGISELAEHLVAERVERVVIESTSDYWRPFYYLLEAAGLVVCWSTPARSKTSRVVPKPTSSTPCGWPSWPSGP